MKLYYYESIGYDDIKEILLELNTYKSFFKNKPQKKENPPGLILYPSQLPKNILKWLSGNGHYSFNEYEIELEAIISSDIFSYEIVTKDLEDMREKVFGSDDSNDDIDLDKIDDYLEHEHLIGNGMFQFLKVFRKISKKVEIFYRTYDKDILVPEIFIRSQYGIYPYTNKRELNTNFSHESFSSIITKW